MNKKCIFIEAGLAQTGKQKPSLLHIPTARPTEQAYRDSIDPVRALYGGELGLPFDVLHDFGNVPAPSIIDEKLAAADIYFWWQYPATARHMAAARNRQKATSWPRANRGSTLPLVG